MVPWVQAGLAALLAKAPGKERMQLESRAVQHVTIDAVPNRRQLVGHDTSVQETTDSGGDDCTWYASRPHLCGCCDDADFFAASCAQCMLKAVPQAWRHVSTELAKFPRKTTSIRRSAWYLYGSLPSTFATDFPNLESLDLSFNVEIQGEIPRGLWGLPRLKEVRLAGNRLTGALPSSVGEAANLVHVDLSQNAFYGQLPESLGRWTAVRHVALYNNQFSGSLPDAIGNWTEVQTVILANNFLTGSLPTAVGQWREVRTVNLGNNLFTGSLPTDLGHWRELVEVKLDNNGFTGSLPDAIGNWGKVSLVWINKNQLTGPIPAAIGSWHELRELGMEYNRLAGGLPEEVGGWRNLERIWMNHNLFTGPFPAAVGQWSNLQIIQANDNKFTELPPTVGAWKQLRMCDFGRNLLTGTLPPVLGNWELVTMVYFYNNQLTGSLPEELGRWRSLETVWLTNNRFTGPIPWALGNWSVVKEVYLSFNQLSGSIPESLGGWANVADLALSDNLLSGPLPQSLGSWSQLKTIRLENNLLTGRLPNSVGAWRQVREVWMHRNRLSGPLPKEMGLWTSLSQISLFENAFSGPMPQWVGNWSLLKTGFFNSNNFSGHLPEGIGNWLQAGDIDLSNTRLSGALPATIGNWTEVTRFQAYNSLISGEIPPEVGSWQRLVYVDMQNCRLTGGIPREMGSWRQVRTVRLNNNSLSGTLPEELGHWTLLELLSLSHNRLSGDVPASVGNWSALFELYLDHNQFSALPAALAGLASLQHLELQENKLQGVLPNLGTLASLTELYLQGNAFEGTLELPKFLRTLDISRNSFTSLPEATFWLQHLEVLMVSSNRISRWPPRGVIANKMAGIAVRCGIQPLEERFSWQNLRRLEASDNPMSEQILDSKGKAVAGIRSFLNSLAYLRSLTDLTCRRCHLSGALLPENKPGLADDQAHTGSINCDNLPPAKAGFPNLQSLDLAENNITEITATPVPNLLSADFSANALENLDAAWFNSAAQYRLLFLRLFSNPKLQMQVSPPSGRCNKTGAQSLVADPDTYVSHEDGSGCTTLCPGVLTKYSADSSLSEAALCRCQPGFGGSARRCRECPSGSYSFCGPSDGHCLLRECRACPIDSGTGGKSGATNITACRCPAGSYLDSAGRACARCTQWPYRATEAAGATQKEACGCNSSYAGLKEFGGVCGCDDGKYMNQASRSCAPCSRAEVCLWGTDLERSLRPPLVKAGYWAEPTGELWNFSSNVIWRCASAETCMLGGVCAEGRHGHACGLCKPRMYGSSDGPCEPCTSSLTPEVHRWALALGLVAVLVPAILLLHLGISVGTMQFVLKLRAVRGSLKQMVKHVQTVSVISNFAVAWPPAAKAFFEALARLTIQLPVLLAVGCLETETSATLEMAVKWSLPVVFVLSALLAMPASWALARLLRALRRYHRWARRMPLPEDLAMRPKDVARVLLFSVTIFWSTLATMSLEILTCVPSPNGQLTVASYPHLRCGNKDREFVRLATVSAFAVILYMLLPLKLLIRGYNRSAICLASTTRVDRGWYGFLFEDFRDGHLVWAVVILVKDALFVVVPTVFPGHGAVQLLVTAALSAAHICLVLQSIPFRERSNTLLEAWNGATAAALCIYSVGMGYEETAGMDDVAELFEEGVEDPIYRGRAMGMVVVQVVAVAVPAAVLLVQVFCAVQRTSDLLPRAVKPISEEEAKEWLEDFVCEAGVADTHLVHVLQRFDDADMFTFRHLFEQTSATMGLRLSKRSSSTLVKRAIRLASQSSMASSSATLSSAASMTSEVTLASAAAWRSKQGDAGEKGHGECAKVVECASEVSTESSWKL